MDVWKIAERCGYQFESALP